MIKVAVIISTALVKQNLTELPDISGLINFIKENL